MQKQIVAVYSEKGGVGKSALTGGLAAASRARGEDALAGDLDPRATLTEELAVENPAFSINDLLYVDTAMPAVDPRGLAAEAITAAGNGWGVDILAASRALANRETDNTAGLEMRLRLTLEGVWQHYRRTLLDLPPRAGGKLVASALVAATHVVIPATLDEDGRIGAEQAMTTIGHIKTSLNPDLVVVAIVPSIVANPRTGLARTIQAHLIEMFGDLYRPDLAIPRHVIRQESRFARVPITSVTGKEAAALAAAYGRVLDAVDAA